MAIDPQKLEELKEYRQKMRAAGGEDKLEKRRQNGLLTARDRIERLFDEKTFLEAGMHVDHNCHNFDMPSKNFPGDGIITGMGQVDGRSIAAFSQDFTIGGGSLGKMHAKKIADLMDKAVQCGMPVVGINDSGGARIQEAVESLSGYGMVFYRNVYLSGVVPQISVIAGPCAGGAAYSPALMDFIIMTRRNANMFICGPDVIKAATGQQTTMDEIGSAEAQAGVAGNVHFIADDDKHAIELVKKLLSYLPSNNVQDPPHDLTVPLPMDDDFALNELVPTEASKPFDVHDVIARVADTDSFFEVHKDWAKNIVVGFARIGGVVVGIVGNQPTVKAGTLDIDSSDKGARFICFCNAFNIPIVSLVDIPGFLPGISQERGGIIRHGAKMLYAYASATVPKITVIMRKMYGGAYLAMCSSEMGADAVYAWPCAEIAVMGAQGAVNILYRREMQSAQNAAELRKKYEQEYSDKFASPYQAARGGHVTDIIEPAETRRTVALALRNLLAKSTMRPPKKHGLMPL
jgi:propionyl-CoA carboxylase beta chain